MEGFSFRGINPESGVIHPGGDRLTRSAKLMFETGRAAYKILLWGLFGVVGGE